MLYFICAEMGIIGEVSNESDNKVSGKDKLTGWCALDEFTNVHVVALGRVLMDQVDLVLENDDMFQSHQLDSSHVLFCLRLEYSSVLIFHREIV